jgi:hypothetical protein
MTKSNVKVMKQLMIMNYLICLHKELILPIRKTKKVIYKKKLVRISLILNLNKITEMTHP